MSELPEIWVFDQNRRVYRRDKHGSQFGSPIWRECWCKVEVIGETRVSWIVRWYGELRVPKNNADPRKFSFSLADIERRAFVVENRSAIAEAVRGIEDFDQMKAVADLIGFSPES